MTEQPRSPLDEARTWAEAGEARNEQGFPDLETVVAYTAAQAWAAISIAESLASIAEIGIETYVLDADGHRR